MSAYTIILHFHSFFRYIALLLLVFAIYKSILGLITKTHFGKNEKIISVTAMGAFHLQVLIGIALYFLSPKVHFTHEMFKVEMFRFFTVEHISIMLISAVLITIGYGKAKRETEKNGNKYILIFYLIALLLVLWSIPWPFKHALSGGWI